MKCGRGWQSLWMAVAGAVCAGVAGLMLVLGAVGGSPEAADEQVEPHPTESPTPPEPFVVPRIDDVVAMSISFPMPERDTPPPLVGADPASRTMIEQVLGWLREAEVLDTEGKEDIHARLRLFTLQVNLKDGASFSVSQAPNCTVSGSSMRCVIVPGEVWVPREGENTTVRLASAEVSGLLTDRGSKEVFRVAPPRCTGDEIKIGSSGFAGLNGAVVLSFVLTNVSDRSCSLWGHAGFAFFDGAGRPLDFRHEEEGAEWIRTWPGAPVLLAPGKRAYMGLEKHGCGRAEAGIARSVHIRLPNDESGEIPISLGLIPVAYCGRDDGGSALFSSSIAGSYRETLR